MTKNDILNLLNDTSKWKKGGWSVEKEVWIDFEEISIKEQREIIFEITKVLISLYDSITKPGIQFCVHITNVLSETICDTLDINPTDFNGWQCDWLDTYYTGQNKIYLFREALYGKCEFTIGEEE